MKARHENQLNLPPCEVRNSDNGPTDRSVFASRVFHLSLVAAEMTNQEVAYVVGVSESLVQKWRSQNDRQVPSLAHLVQLPPRFWIEMWCLLNDRLGLRDAAVERVAAALADLKLLEG